MYVHVTTSFTQTFPSLNIRNISYEILFLFQLKGSVKLIYHKMTSIMHFYYQNYSEQEVGFPSRKASRSPNVIRSQQRSFNINWGHLYQKVQPRFDVKKEYHSVRLTRQQNIGTYVLFILPVLCSLIHKCYIEDFFRLQ